MFNKKLLKNIESQISKYEVKLVEIGFHNEYENTYDIDLAFIVNNMESILKKQNFTSWDKIDKDLKTKEFNVYDSHNIYSYNKFISLSFYLQNKIPSETAQKAFGYTSFHRIEFIDVKDTFNKIENVISLKNVFQ